jgi:prepilin-type N-terminal cleavage/methylation domain-containing protein
VMQLDRARRWIRANRGYTLVELVIVAVVATVLLGILVRWAFALVSATQTSSAGIQVARDLTVVSAVLTADVRAAQGCDPVGLDGPVAGITDTTLTLLADVSGPGGAPDGIPDQVSWRLEGSRLQRAVTVGPGTDNGCTFTNPAWQTVIERAVTTSTPEGGSFPVFALYRQGLSIETTDEMAECRVINPEICLADAVQLRLRGESVTGASDSSIALVIPLSTAGSRLGGPVVLTAPTDVNPATPAAATVTSATAAGGTITVNFTVTSTAAAPVGEVLVARNGAAWRVISAAEIDFVGELGNGSFTDSTIIQGTGYRYTLTTRNPQASGMPVSTSTLTIYGIPSTPEFTAVTVGSSQVGLTWTQITGSISIPVSGYRIFRSPNINGPYGLLVTTLGDTATTHVDTTVQAGSTFYYQVEAYGPGGTSGRSASAGASVP